jgi:hypothetical protein
MMLMLIKIGAFSHLGFWAKSLCFYLKIMKGLCKSVKGE